MNAPELKWTALDHINEAIRLSGSLECFLDELHREILSLSMEAEEASQDPVCRSRRRWARNSGVLSRVATHVKVASHECAFLEGE